MLKNAQWKRKLNIKALKWLYSKNINFRKPLKKNNIKIWRNQYIVSKKLKTNRLIK